MPFDDIWYFKSMDFILIYVNLFIHISLRISLQMFIFVFHSSSFVHFIFIICILHVLSSVFSLQHQWMTRTSFPEEGKNVIGWKYSSFSYMFVLLINKTINIISFIKLCFIHIFIFICCTVYNIIHTKPFHSLFHMCFTFRSAGIRLECWVYPYIYLYIYVCPVRDVHGDSLVYWSVRWLPSGLYWSLLIPASIFCSLLVLLLFIYAKTPLLFSSHLWLFILNYDDLNRTDDLIDTVS